MDFKRRKFLAGTGALAAGTLLPVTAIERAFALTGPEPIKAGYFPVRGGGAWFRMNGMRHFSAGKTPLVVIHGGPGMSHHYLLPIVDLSNERPVIFYDQLDSGHSDRPNDPANWAVDRFVSEIDDLRDALGLHKLAVLGNSWGGTLTAEYAMRQPPGLQAAILSGPLISTERWISDNTEYREQLSEDVQETMRRHEEAGTTGSDEYQEATMVFYRKHFNRQDPWPPELNRTFEVFSGDLYETMWGPTEFNATGRLKDYDSTDRLPQIRVPALYICGEYDESTPQANQDFASMTPNAEVKVIEDASHTPFLEQRQSFVTSVREFLARTIGD